MGEAIGSAPQFDWSKQTGAGPEAYDSFLVPAMFTPFGRKLCAAVGIHAGARVLDVACGTGAVSRVAAEAAGAHGSVTGVDMGPAMLAVARSKPAEPGAAPIEYLEGDAGALPVPDGAFDVVLCHHGLQFFPDKPAAVAEMRRALHRHGRVGVGVWDAPERQPTFGALAGALERQFGTEVATMMRSPFAMHDLAAIAALFEGAGFTDVEIERETLPVTFASHADFARVALSAGPLGPVFASAPAEQQEAVVADVHEALAPYATEDGRLATEMTSIVTLATAP